jgi:DNA modification methylase
MKYELKQGDNAKTLKQYPENYFDSIVTDPPYGIEFMGKDWDKHTGALETWQECFRVLKPGGHILAFSASRTYHHLATNIEAVGFEIRDQIMWLYGKGFPKSHNIGKAIDKKAGAERKVIGTEKTPFKVDGKAQEGVSLTGSVNGDFCKQQDEDGFRVKVITEAATEEAKQWEGWGTALKPAHEPIVMARKPLSENTVVDNVLKHGTGGINIDGSRIETEENLNGGAYAKNGTERHDGAENWRYKREGGAGEFEQPKGRFPANLIHDGSDEVVNNFPITKSGQLKSTSKTRNFKFDEAKGKAQDRTLPDRESSEGSASRFFKEINNHEPIVMARKPLSEKTVVDNVLKHGTGGINIDDSRVSIDPNDANQRPNGSGDGVDLRKSTEQSWMGQNWSKQWQNTLNMEKGRFPANIIHDGSDEIVNEFPITKSGALSKGHKQGKGMFGKIGGDKITGNYGNDKGSASRFFYSAKVSKKERNIGQSTDGKNNHPTVKPVALMKYLITLITPKGGKVLDPFNGSGSTGMACVELGYEYTGCELDPDYIEISKARIEAWYAENKPEEVNEYFDKI